MRTINGLDRVARFGFEARNRVHRRPESITFRTKRRTGRINFVDVRSERVAVEFLLHRPIGRTKNALLRLPIRDTQRSGNYAPDGWLRACWCPAERFASPTQPLRPPLTRSRAALPRTQPLSCTRWCRDAMNRSPPLFPNGATHADRPVSIRCSKRSHRVFKRSRLPSST